MIRGGSMRNRANIVVIAILLLLLLVAISYIGYDKYITASAIKDYNLVNQGFQEGARQGYQQAILQVMQQSLSCQQVPLFVGNQTINIIAVDCLKEMQVSNANAVVG